MDYRLVSFLSPAGAAAAGVLIGDRVHRAASLLAGAAVDASSVLGLLQGWDVARPLLAAARPNPEDGRPLAETRLLAPILYPGTVFCAGANYWDHMAEMAEVQRRATGQAPAPFKKPDEPWFFLKTAASSIVGPGAPVRFPHGVRQLDWEAELGVVIGRTARNLPVERAFEAVAGYVIFHDLSARDLMRREDRTGTPFVFDWLGQKCFDDAAPMGPWIAPHDAIGDPHDLSIKLWVNGVLKQDSNSGRMIHRIDEQIAYLSRRVTLRPGDVIATGTPAGVGHGRGEYLKPGDVVRIDIAQCGSLVNPIVAEPG
jgi:2-keto-4-pentenoate hydratase/2-oxohepta-3-ene-1,7-dioic acid hydratase in catechol pathway